ncbi:beta-ketoacyl synthase N-terminal-like domain-containing protein [Magnetospirillum sulfuroxidans]|uniref:Ketosynthase family 3 (KS3) domain-containing protein n=1 Tax=Magnetospirillum sulfuroxidans TaxID=611300 RepID=A0ABS5I7D0_9PROT|nr:beta-ketoacyl synthase N-terminal-like domain-containing protein [Magnetospirillum sulfuroxidans]MBR9970334.1 hypothetical protein [Magnetospirillum sulfuroxidans]
MANSEVFVAGIGAACGLGWGKAALIEGLLAGRDVFSVLARPGRQAPDGSTAFIGVEMPEPPDILPPRVARTAGFGARAAIAVLDEAWREAGLDDVDPQRIGLIVGGANLSSREHLLAVAEYADRLKFIPPRHGHVFFDSDIVGLCASTYAIRGFAHSLGAASASGAVAVLHAAEAIRAGRVDVCIALGAVQDVSYLDLLGLRALGAMGSSRFADRPGLACRPFDVDHDGFLYGEACAALVLRRGAGGYGSILGGAQVVDGQRGPEPCGEGQSRAIAAALAQAGMSAAAIDYVNAHGTGTPKGDEIEAATLRSMGLQQAWINAGKSITGHGLAAAGAIEVAASFLQMHAGALHPTRNLDTPLDPNLRWVRGGAQSHRIRHALKVSFGFAGCDTALVLGAPP